MNKIKKRKIKYFFFFLFAVSMILSLMIVWGDNKLTFLPNSTVSGHIVADQGIYYSIPVTKDGDLTVTIGKTAGGNCQLQISTPDGREIVRKDNWHQEISLTVEGLKPENYIVRVFLYGAWKNTDFVLTNVFTEAPLEKDQETNDSYTQAISMPINSSVTGHIGYDDGGSRDENADADDWWKINLEQKGDIKIFLTQIRKVNLYLCLYKNDGATRVTDADTWGNDTTLEGKDLEPGIYYIRIYRYSSNFTPYTLTVSGPGNSTVTTAPEVPAVPQTTDTGAEAFDSGVRLMWSKVSDVLGYRLFRSEVKGELGISVTDFYITSTSYADVNVKPDTTYYHSVKPVLSEANPYQGIEEKLGDTIATFVVTTGSKIIYDPFATKHFIMLKLDSPYMSIDGVEYEVEPGRGTTPIIIGGRTMVPIRAVVEAMGGSVGWDGNTSLITLNARGNKVEMWLGKKEIKVNGVIKEMDIAPVAKDGRTYVPVRFAAENLNCKVDWINSTKEAVIVYEE